MWGLRASTFLAICKPYWRSLDFETKAPQAGHLEHF